jgi:hypothetical protein
VFDLEEGGGQMVRGEIKKKGDAVRNATGKSRRRD